MKAAYPIILSKGKEHIIVYVPDFSINTQGSSIAEAMEMARDAIGIVGIDMEDDHEQLPVPTAIERIKIDTNSMLSYVDVDFDEYRRKNEMRSVKKNCTIPSWLNYEAEKSNINFSAVLQEALIEKLSISDR